MREKSVPHLNNGCGEEQPVPKLAAFLPLGFAVTWVCALTCLCVSLRYAEPIREYVPDVKLPVKAFVTPTLDWPTPVPTNTPRPTMTPTVTPTPFAELPPTEEDAIAALIVYEALREPVEGQAAVAYVVLHRAAQTNKLPSQVLTEEFFGSGSGAKRLATRTEWWRPSSSLPLADWQQAMNTVLGVVNGWLPDEFPTSTHYYSTCVLSKPPVWAKDKYFLGQIGCHRFYSIPAYL